METQIATTNRKAYHEYHILDKYEAGIELLGSEVKSLREGNVNIKQAYITIRNGQALAIGIHINPYSHTGFEGHDSVRDRRLLLHKREIKKIKDLTDQKGLTAIPLQLYFNPNGRAKLEIGIAKGKNTYDKKKVIRERDIKRDVQRDLRNR